MKMLSRLALAAAVVALSGPAWAGPKREVRTHAGECRILHLMLPGASVADYVEAQKERLEESDPAVIKRLSETVLVSIALEPALRDMAMIAECMETGPLQRIVVAHDEKPLLVVPLRSREREVKNLLGMTVTVFEASAEIPLADLKPLLGSDQGFDMRIVYANYVHKAHWNNDWAEKLLK